MLQGAVSSMWVIEASDEALTQAIRAREDVRQWKAMDGKTVYHEAANRHLPKALEAWVEMGGRADVRDGSGDTALHYALFSQGGEPGSADEKAVFEWLLDQGLGHREHEEGQYTPYLVAVVDRWGDTPGELRQWLGRFVKAGMNLTEEGDHRMPGSPIEVLAVQGLQDEDRLRQSDQALAMLHEDGYLPAQQLRWALARAEQWFDEKHEDVQLEAPVFPTCHSILQAVDLATATKSTDATPGVARPRM